MTFIFYVLKPDISIHDPPLYIHFRKTVFSVYKFCTCVYHPLWHSHSLTHSHNCVCMGVWVCLCYTHTHTLTHTPAPQTTCLIDTFCAQKSLHSLNFSIRSSNQVGTSFYQQPIWYSFPPLLYLVDFTYFGLHKKYPKTLFYWYFLEEKIDKRVYYIKQI